MRVLVATAIWPQPQRPGFGSFVKTQVDALVEAGIDVDVMVLDAKPRKAIYVKAPLGIRRRVRSSRPDLVHAHYGMVGMVARTQYRAPLVVTFHGDDLLGTIGPNGRITAFGRVEMTAGRLLGAVADAVIVQSAQMAARLRRRDVHVIPHEVDLEVFRPSGRDEARAALGLDPERRYLLFAADPAIPVKRFPLAREAFERLRRDDPELELLVVHRETQPRLALYMSACDALVFPSFQEGSPNIVKQAMACNLPIVATPVGDVREVVGETAGCRICAPTVDAFAQGVSEVLAQGGRTQGRDAVAHLTRPLVAARVIEVYEQVARATHARDGQALVRVGGSA
jgi:glycosyltransferase involved in cell wall biosynthesis